MSDHQPPIEEEVVTVPPKKARKKNKTVIIVISVILGLIILSGLALAAIGWFAYDKTSDSIKDAMEQSQSAMNEADDERSDPYATQASQDEHGGQIYDTSRGLPDTFPEAVAIVQPSKLRQITSQAREKGGTPIRWDVLTETNFTSASEVRAAIKSAYRDFGDKRDRSNTLDDGDQTISQSYYDGTYNVNAMAFNDSGYQSESDKTYMIRYTIQVKE